MLKAPIKWAGGKTKLIPTLVNFFNCKFTTYIEPFCGSGSVFINLINYNILNKQTKIIISDINTQLIMFFYNIQNNIDDLIKWIEYYLFFPYDELRNLYNNNIKIYDCKISALFFVLNKRCYNGLYRTNKKGSFNVPEGKYAGNKVYKFDNDKKNLLLLHQIFNNYNIKFLSMDYEYFLINEFADSILYLDPPYYPINKKSFIKYYDDFDFNRFFNSLRLTKNKFICSQSYCNYVIENIGNFKFYICYMNRNISCKERNKVKEIIIYNLF